MATKVRAKTANKKLVRFKRKGRIRARLEGTPERPRMAVFRSNRYFYVQVIDDVAGKTLVSGSTQEEELRGKVTCSIEGVKQLGALVAKRALAKNISQVVFDRSGYLYHGRVKALADSAREGGLKF